MRSLHRRYQEKLTGVSSLNALEEEQIRIKVVTVKPPP